MLKDTGEIAVIGFLFQLTNSIFSSFYDQCNAPEDASIVFTNVLSSIFCIRNPGTTTVLPPISFSPLTNTIRTMAFYTYSGSLTTPPCTENVTWLIATEPLSIPVDAYNALKKVVKFNARFPQNRLGEENLISLACMNLNVTEREGLSLNKDAFETPMQRGKISGMVDSSEKVIALDGASF